VVSIDMCFMTHRTLRLPLDRFCSCSVLQCVAVCCSVLQSGAVCCGVLEYGAGRCRVLRCVAVCCRVLQDVAVRCSVLQCVAVCCSVLQCVSLCCSVLQYTCMSVFAHHRTLTSLTHPYAPITYIYKCISPSSCTRTSCTHTYQRLY